MKTKLGSDKTQKSTHQSLTKPFGKKFMSLVLCICMLTAMLSAMPSAVYAETTINRAEWISSLVTAFSMSVDDESTMPDNYFSDITTDTPYYHDILLAVEFGVIDLGAGEAFEPEKPATREFAAHTLNFCLKFQLEEKQYTYSESSDVSYPDDIQVAINRGWFNLSGNNFMPQQGITKAESDVMLGDAKTIVSGQAINSEYESKYEFGEGVKVIPETVNTSIATDYTVTITDYECNINAGDIFVVYSAGIPVALKAISIEKNENVTTVSATADGTENVVTSVDSEGVAEFDLENFETNDVETYSITDVDSNETSEMQISLQSINYDKKAKKLTATKEIKVSGTSNAGSITVEVSDLKLYHKENTKSGDYMAYIQGNTSVTKSISFDIGNYVGIPSSITLGYINVGGIGNVSLNIDISIKGGMSSNETGVITTGFSYARNDGFRLINGYKKTAYSFTAEAEVKVGLTLSANIDLVVMSGRIWATVGVKGYFKFKDYTYVDGERPLQCKTIGGFLYANVGASASINYFIDKKSWSKTIDIYTESNSPIRVYYHYEDNQLVDCCTRGKDNNEAYIKYTTHTNSAYFNPSPSYGQGSYTGGDGTTTTLWTYTTDSEGNATITGYKGSASSIAIPSTIDGYTVTKIGSGALKGANIRSVTMPDNIVEIENWAFANCTNLVNVTLSKGLIEIENDCFNNCTKLNNVEIPASLTKYESWYGSQGGPFARCSSLKNVTFESGTTTIVQSLFYYCTGLETIDIPDTVTEIGAGAFRYCTNLKNVSIPDSVTIIRNRAFADCTALDTISIPDSVTEIENWAFANCTNLVNVTLSKGLIEIENDCFNNCTKLNNVEIPASLTKYESWYGSQGGPFARCSSLKNVTFESGTTTIVQSLFYYCTGLETIDIPDTVTEIGAGAFRYCTNLKNVSIPDSVTIIRSGAFADCTALDTISIPDSVTEIEQWTFRNCTNLANVTLSKGLIEIENDCFNNCTKLNNVEIPASLTKYESWYGSQGGPFARCSSLKNVTFESGTTTIVQSLFYYCTGLETIDIPDTVTEIGAWAFENCTNLKTVTIPDSVTKIDDSAFYRDTGLTEIKIPDSVTSMGENIFSGCTSLEKVKLPDTCQTIMKNTFYNCKSLKDIVLPETVTAIRENAFYGCTSLPSINLPDGLQTIEDNAFYECKALTDITIPKSVTSIGSKVFYNCDGLQKAVINASGEIGYQAFYDCDALTSLTLADSITKIGSSLCYGCDKLTDIKFGKYITEIPDSTFRKCAALQSVTLPRFCKTVAANAFAEDTKLTAAYVPVSVSSIQSNSFSYPKKMTMYGKDGSYAQEYASGKSMAFSAVNAPISGFSFADNTLTVDRYKTFTEPLNISPDFDTDTITFTSSNTNVATVSETGEIYTRSYGSVKISAKANDGNKTATLNLTVAAPVHAEAIKLDKNNISLRLGTTAKLNATVTPSNTSDTVRWATSDRNIVTVENGNLTPVAMGTATITAITSNGLTDRCTVTVLTDSVISKLSAKRNGTTLTASLESVKVENGAKAVFAAYTSKNVLCGMTEVFVSDNAATAEFKAENAAYVKAFIWKANGMIPIVTPERVTVQ